MEFHILGPIRVCRDGRTIDLGAKKVRGVLGILLLAANTGVPANTVVERLWPERPTADGHRNPTGKRESSPGKNTLQVYVSRLRKVLDDESIPATVHHDQGAYRIIVDSSTIDYHRFRRLAESGRVSARSGDHRRAIELFGEALELWQGVPLADLVTSWAERIRENMTRNDLLATRYELIDSHMAIGDVESARELLRLLQPDHDTDEAFAQRWMRVVADTEGPDKLPGYFRSLTERLREALDEEPSEYLHRTYRRLTQPSGSAASVAHRGRGSVLRMLPRPSPYFTGRIEVMSDLDTKLLGPGTPAVVAISGSPAVGKSELATYWGVSRRQHFPDGDLYYNLNGYGPGQVAGQATVLSFFISALGFPSDRLPTDIDGRGALLKRLLADRRMLVVLDNARDSAHVGPLLAAMPNCWVIITSQQRLTPLVHREARLVTLRMLADDESVELLDRRIADPRVTEEPDAVRDLAALVGGLPLGLHVAADIVSTIADMPIRELVTELRMRRRALLDAGNYGDDSTRTLRIVFSLAYEQQTPTAARVFRMMGLLPVTSTTTSAVAALAGLSDEEAERSLAALVGAHLVDQQGTDRVRLHDLLHLFTVELAGDESSASRSAALHRLFDWYLGSTVNAIHRVSPHMPMVSPQAPATSVRPKEFEDSAVAMRWCVAERSAVPAIAGLAAEHGFHEHAWRLVGMFDDILHRFGATTDLLAIQRAALRSAELAGSLEGRIGHLNELGMHHYNLQQYEQAEPCFQQAYQLSRGTEFEILGETSLHNLAAIRKIQGEYDEAIRLFTTSLRRCEHTGYVLGQAFNHRHLGDTYRLMEQPDHALDHFQIALRLYDELDDPRGRGEVRSALGRLALDRGDVYAAIGYCKQALDFNRQAMDERLIAESLTTLALAYCGAGAGQDALEHAREAVEVGRSVGLHALADALEARGRAYLAVGDPLSASTDWQECLAILQELGSPRTAELRVLIDKFAGQDRSEQD